MHPLELSGLQVLEILLEGPFVKLGQKGGRGGGIQLLDSFDELTFRHRRFTFEKDGGRKCLPTSHRKSQCPNLNLRAKPPSLPPIGRIPLPICTKCRPRPAWAARITWPLTTR